MKKVNGICRRVMSRLLVLMLLSCITYAAGSLDTSRNVRLTLSYRDGTTPLSGAEFRIYRVAAVDETGELTVTDAFRQFNVDIRGEHDAAWKELASTLEGYVLRDGLAAADSGTTGGDGSLTFPTDGGKLQQGLYLVLGLRHTQEGCSYDAAPFMVMLPAQDMEQNAWTYELSVSPKYDRREIPDTPSVTTRRVLKVWNDAGSEGLRPQEVTVQLLRDTEVYDTVTLNEQNSWRYTWTQLDERYTWTVAEKEQENYTVTVTREGITFVVTNTYAPAEPEDGTVTRTVLKVWEDPGYEDSRPDLVQVTLLRDGTAFDTQTLSEANGWRHTWDGLPRCDENGREYTWSIQETHVPGYVSDIRESGGIFTLTNTPEQPRLPQTGMLWWPVPLLAIGGLTLLAVGMLNRKKDDE